jgi:hypothetical protein
MGFIRKVENEKLDDMETLTAMSVRSGLKMLTNYLATVTPNDCDELCAQIDAANAFLCSETGRLPSIITRSAENGPSVTSGDDRKRENDAGALSVMAS